MAAAVVASSSCADHSHTSVKYVVVVAEEEEVDWVHPCIPFHLDQIGSAW